ncbi:hypothetical protein JCM19241_1051 [Vibrio ishigakensis]|uniref:Uncharacterized protein n=1 Tax=Vibrio ishigakensis TaxID=1481914 RepID=A0A0B8QHN1_9VIBR|nr:hypothetical protein JCM19241_1051 [Vibrio ishigakensis]
MTPEIKLSVTAIITAITVYSYVPYVLNTVRGNIKPHFYTWLIWALIGGISITIAALGHGGIGLIPIAIGAVSALIIAISTFKNASDATKSDKIFLAASLMAIPVWYFTSGAVAALMAATINVIASIPTIRNAWINPSHETPSTWLLNGIRFGAATAVLNTISVETASFTVAMTGVNFLVFGILIVRTKALKHRAKQAECLESCECAS